MKLTPEPAGTLSFPALSKRAARRLIQRAFVLVGRERSVRQHLREANVTTLWVLEDWGLEWTVVLNHGKLEFRRGQAGEPRLTFVWRTAEEFFSQIEGGLIAEGAFECLGSPALRKFSEPVYAAFAASLRAVLANPVDDEGERLV